MQRTASTVAAAWIRVKGDSEVRWQQRRRCNQRQSKRGALVEKRVHVLCQSLRKMGRLLVVVSWGKGKRGGRRPPAVLAVGRCRRKGKTGKAFCVCLKLGEEGERMCEGHEGAVEAAGEGWSVW